LWSGHTPYRGEDDWIFASPFFHGRTPFTYQILFRKHIRPVIERIAGIKSSKQAPIGWRMFRRSLATLLISNGENVKVTQSQLRHTMPKITLESYAQVSRMTRRCSSEGRPDGRAEAVVGEVESKKSRRQLGGVLFSCPECLKLVSRSRRKSFRIFGERAGTRTQDPRLKRALLYQLSYAPTHI